MFDYIYIYIIEAVCCIFSWLIGFIIFKTKNKKNYWKYFGIISIIYIVIFGISFLLEEPYMKINNSITFEANSEKTYTYPKTTFHFQDVTNQVRVSDNVNLNKLGEYEANFEYDTLIGTYSKIVKVNVVDTTPPVISLNGETEFKQSYSTDYIEPGFTAIDSYDGDLSDKVQISKEEINESEYILNYEVSDSSNNKATLSRKIIIVDDIPPVITLNGNSTIYVTLNNKYSEQGAKAVDEKDGDLTERIVTEGNVDTSKTGTYSITYTVSDTKGNQAILTRKIIVTTPNNNNNGSSNGVIYLTFDDGPTTSSTPKILDILEAKNVKATFFILNYDSEGEKLVQREYNEGHTIGIHGYSHVYSDIYQSVDIYMNNITKLQDKIKASTGYNSTITRFPGGSSNTVSRFNPGIMTKLTKEVVARGYKYFDWNVSSGDAGGAKNSSDVYNNVINGLSKNRSNVVLMHDFANNNKTINALADIIDYGLTHGYTFSPITEDTPMVTHGVNN